MQVDCWLNRISVRRMHRLGDFDIVKVHPHVKIFSAECWTEYDLTLTVTARASGKKKSFLLFYWSACDETDPSSFLIGAYHPALAKTAAVV